MERGDFVPLDPDRFLKAVALAARQLREEHKARLAQCQARWRLGLQTLRDWEKETYTPSLHNLIKLANGLQIDFREIIERAVQLYGKQG